MWLIKPLHGLRGLLGQSKADEGQASYALQGGVVADNAGEVPLTCDEKFTVEALEPRILAKARPYNCDAA